MVGVRGIGGVGPLRPGRGVRAGGAGFSLTATADGAAAAAAQAAAPASAAGLLAVQEAGPPAERDARAHRRGLAMLEALDSLQADLLAGRIHAARLDELAALAEGEAAADPALSAALDAITLRVRVELARRGR